MWQAHVRVSGTHTDSHFLVFMSLCNSLPLWTGPSNYLLMNRIRQKWCDVTFEIGYKKTLALSCFLPCPPTPASSYTVSCPMERFTLQRTDVFQPTASTGRRPANNQRRELGSEFLPKSSLEMTTVQANTLIAGTWKTLSLSVAVSKQMFAILSH